MRFEAKLNTVSRKVEEAKKRAIEYREMAELAGVPEVDAEEGVEMLKALDRQLEIERGE